MAPKNKSTKRAAAPAQEPKTPAGKILPTTSKTPAVPMATDEAVAAQAPAAKKIKVDPMLAGVEEGILQARDLPEVVRDMLLAGLPGSLFCAQRREVQNAIVNMADKTLRSVEATLQAAVETEEAVVVAADAARESCKTRVAEADGLLATAKQNAENENNSVAAATRELETAQAVLAESLATQRAGDAPIEKARRTKDELDKAIDVSLAAVLTGSENDASKAHCHALLPIAASLGLDESLLSALPAACGKKAPQRGHFDKIVVAALEASLKEGREAIIQTIASEAPASDQRAATVRAAEVNVACAKEALRQASERSTQATAQELEAAKVHQAALEAVDRSVPDCQEAAARRDEQKEKLNHFRQHNLTCFDVLRLRDSKREEATPEKAEALPENVPSKNSEVAIAETTVSICAAGA
jgi:hypothetical protein